MLEIILILLGLLGGMGDNTIKDNNITTNSTEITNPNPETDTSGDNGQTPPRK